MNSRDPAPSIETAPAEPVLPELLAPPRAPVPVRPVWMPWPIAVLLAPLFWLMPRQFGPHFAAAGWRAAIAAYLTWTLYGTCCLVLVETWPDMHGRETGSCGPVSWVCGKVWPDVKQGPWPGPNLSEALRIPLVYPRFLLRERGYLFERFAVLLATAHVGGLLIAVALMPYVSVGERGRLLLGRLVRLTLWASTSVILAAPGRRGPGNPR